MRVMIKEFVRECAAVLPFQEPICEFGAYQVRGQEGFADLRPLFPGKAYIGADMRQGPGVEALLNLHDLGMAESSVSSVLMLDTLEHVEKPWRAMEEVHRVLAPNGIVLISSVMNFPIHGHPEDYWRFTPEAFKSLLQSFTFSLVEWVGEEEFPETVVGIGCKSIPSPETIQQLQTRLAAWKAYWMPQPVPEYALLARKLLPPVMLEAYRTVRDNTYRRWRGAAHHTGR